MKPGIAGVRQDVQKKTGDQKTDNDEINRKARNILRSLRGISSFLQGNAKQIEARTQLNSTMLGGLWELHDHPGLKVSELADIMVIHQSTCSNLLKKLQKQELVYKDRSSDDQRIVRLYLTDKGMKLLETTPRPDHGPITNALLDFSAAELAEMEKILALLAAATGNAGKD